MRLVRLLPLLAPLALAAAIPFADLPLAGQQAPAARKPRKVALLVGPSTYLHDFTPLNYTARDVEALAAVLREGGFDEVVVLTDPPEGKNPAAHATRKNILAQLEKLVARQPDEVNNVRRGDVVLVFLSGHGMELDVPDPDNKTRTRREAFFAPTDGRIGKAETLISLDHLVNEILAPCGGRNLILVDACREIRDENKGKGIGGKAVTLRGESAVLFSCQSGEMSQESNRMFPEEERKKGMGHGVFTYAILEVVKDSRVSGKALNWSRLVSALEEKMSEPAVRNLLPAGQTQTPVLAAGQVPPTELFAAQDQGRREPREGEKGTIGLPHLTLLSFDSTTLVGLSRTQGTDELELLPSATLGWDIVKPAKHKADEKFVDELAAELGRLRVERIAGHGKKGDMYKQFGLDPAAAVFTLRIGETAEVKTLRVGNPVASAKPNGERYATVDTSNLEVIVGVLPAALVNKLLAPPVAFRDRRLATVAKPSKAMLECGDRKVTFAKAGSTWKVTEPLIASAESTELESLVADLGKLRAETWVAEKGKDLKPFGLDKPEAKWTLLDGDRTLFVLLLGKKTTDGRVHFTTDTGELVGLLDVTLTARVLGEYRQRRPWDVDAARVESVSIACGEYTFTLEKAGQAWVNPGNPTSPLDGRGVNELLGTLSALRVERYVVDKDADLKLFGLEKPKMTLTVTTDVGKRVLEVGGEVVGTLGKQRYARVVDKGRSDVFVLSAIDRILFTDK